MEFGETWYGEAASLLDTFYREVANLLWTS